jgi:hypothetical protein
VGMAGQVEEGDGAVEACTPRRSPRHAGDRSFQSRARRCSVYSREDTSCPVEPLRRAVCV